MAPITYKGKSNYKISFHSKKMCTDLLRYGIKPNKSTDMDPVPIDLIPNHLLKFYFRGLIDGDGCIKADGSISIYSGDKEYIKDVQKILCENAGVKQEKEFES